MRAYQLKITIKGSHPPIWRRLLVPAGLSFNQLTLVLNEAVGWSGDYTCSFIFGNLNAVIMDKPDPELQGRETLDLLDAASEIIDDYLDAVKSFTYIYDMGEGWSHQVQVEDVREDYPYDYPQVIKARGGNLYEDCSSIEEYARIRKILADPEDLQYEEISAFAQACSIEYDMDEANELLKDMRLTEEKSAPMTLEELYNAYFEEEPFRTIDPELGKKQSAKIIPFPGPAELPEEEYEDEDEDEDDFDREQLFQEAVSFGTNVTLIHVIQLLKEKTRMGEKQILKLLEIDDDHYEELKELQDFLENGDFE